jgi:hypothetical protein
MSDGWAATWSVSNDRQDGLSVTWTDPAGEHTAKIFPPGAGLRPCEARTVTPARNDLLCGRVSGHDGCHVSIDQWRRLGSVAG